MQDAVLHGELEVLHVGKFPLQRAGTVLQLLPGRRGNLLQCLMTMGVAPSSHHILALGIGQKVHPQRLGAGAGVPREANASARVVTGVAEHHGLDRDGRSHGFVDAVASPVVAGFFAVPGGKYRTHRAG